MKKLLALILCVMMFVAVIPTSAFAGGGIKVDPAYPLPDPAAATYTHEWAGKMAATKAVEDLGDAIKNMYSGLAASEGVFNTVKSIDSTIKSMAEDIFKDVNDVTVFGTPYTNKELTDKTKTFLRNHIGDEITKYLNDHQSSFTSEKTMKDGTKYQVIDPVKYMNTFATAASKAMSSEKAAKNIEAVVYLGAMAKTAKDTHDKMDDLYNDMQAWGDLDKLAAYGWTNPTSAATVFDPYVFLDAENPYLDYSVSASDPTDMSNVYEALNQWVAAK
jgi:hypothetical protein